MEVEKKMKYLQFKQNKVYGNKDRERNGRRYFRTSENIKKHKKEGMKEIERIQGKARKIIFKLPRDVDGNSGNRNMACRTENRICNIVVS